MSVLDRIADGLAACLDKTTPDLLAEAEQREAERRQSAPVVISTPPYVPRLGREECPQAPDPVVFGIPWHRCACGAQVADTALGCWNCTVCAEPGLAA